MTPCTGLYVALVPLVIAGLAILSAFMKWPPIYAVHGSHAEFGNVVLVFFGVIFGLIVMGVGLALVGVLALITQRNKPSYIGLVLQVVGVTLLVCGYIASQSVGDAKVGETMAYLIGGIVALWGGAALALWGGRRAMTKFIPSLGSRRQRQPPGSGL